MIKEILKYACVIVLLIIFTTGLFLFSVYYGAQSALTDSDYYAKIADKADISGDYYSLVAKNAEEMLEFNGTTGGADGSVFNGVINKDNVKRATHEYIESVINGTEQDFQLTEITDILRTRLVEYYAGNNGIEATEYSINQFVAYLNEETVQTVKLPYLAKVYPHISTFFTGHDLIIIPIAILLLAAVALIIKAIFKNTELCIKLCCGAVAATGVMYVITAIFLLCQNNRDVFGFSTDIVRIYLSEVKTDSVIACFAYAAFFIFAAISVCYAAYRIFHRKEEETA